MQSLTIALKRILISLLFRLLGDPVTARSEPAEVRQTLSRLHRDMHFQSYLTMQDEKLKDRLAGGSGLTLLPPLDNAVLLGQRKQIAYFRENMRVAYEKAKRETGVGAQSS